MNKQSVENTVLLSDWHYLSVLFAMSPRRASGDSDDILTNAVPLILDSYWIDALVI
ncbi:hypothetical protein [Roseiconus lacunae]|uniref:hypothetical protein n=1 Tax=Roseiconus lacunae TaxID=2605694 RepID=UPI0013575697|nr:hypothetical protein [Roseiconus lacunae]